MNTSRQLLAMTTVAAICTAPLFAFGQANTGGSSQMQTTTQTTPQQGPTSGAPAARGAATTGSDTGMAPNTGGTAPSGQRAQGMGPGTAQGTGRDGTPGNPPSTATQRGSDAITGQRTDPDGTGNNPPGTAAGRAMDRATGTDTTTGAATPGIGVDSARLQGGRRASQVIGANVVNENNETIGEVDDLVVTPGGGQPVAVLSVGGFLGIGARLIAVPYERLQYNAERDRWMLQGATRDSLRSLPEFTYPDERRRG
jgi:hypothetical protein